MKDETVTSEYDVDSAVTFLLVGLGVGAVLALVFNPRKDRSDSLERYNNVFAPNVRREVTEEHAA